MKTDEIIAKLNGIYPDKEVSSFSTEHRKLYDAVKRYSVHNKTTISAILEKWGFTYNFGGLPFDPAIATTLVNVFGVRNQRFCEWTGYSKQMISNMMLAYQNGNLNPVEGISEWQGIGLEPSTYEIVTQMVSGQKHQCSQNGIRVILGNDGSGNVYLVVVRNDAVKVYFNDTLPKKLLDLIKEKRLDVLSTKEIAFMNEGSYVNIALKSHFKPKKSMQTAFYAAAHKKGMYADDYSIHLTGCPCALALDKNTDDKIIRFFKSNSIQGKIYLSSDASNQWIRNLASRRNISLKGLVSMYGLELADKGFSRRHPELFPLLEMSSIDTSKFETSMEEKLKILNSFNTLIGENSRKSQSINVPKRNADISKILKKLYDHRCQICGNDPAIPPIIGLDGKPFVEAHHYKGLAGVKDIKNNSKEILDRASNMLVLCNHHHTYVAKHGGGFHKAFKDKNGDVWLQNKLGEKIKLAINYHFMKDPVTEHGLMHDIKEKEAC